LQFCDVNLLSRQVSKDLYQSAGSTTDTRQGLLVILHQYGILWGRKCVTANIRSQEVIRYEVVFRAPVTFRIHPCMWPRVDFWDAMSRYSFRLSLIRHKKHSTFSYSFEPWNAPVQGENELHPSPCPSYLSPEFKHSMLEAPERCRTERRQLHYLVIFTVTMSMRCRCCAVLVGNADRDCLCHLL
jgi:hypothetical protein